VHQLSEARRAGARLVFEEQRRASEAVEAIGRASADVAPQLGMLPLQRTASGSRNVASTARELHQALADTVAEGLRVNTEACLDALRCTTLPELSRLHGRLLAQWMRLNSDMGSRVVRATQRAFLGGFTSDADRMGRR
jgi:hypothetical protein